MATQLAAPSRRAAVLGTVMRLLVGAVFGLFLLAIVPRFRQLVQVAAQVRQGGEVAWLDSVLGVYPYLVLGLEIAFVWGFVLVATLIWPYSMIDPFEATRSLPGVVARRLGRRADRTGGAVCPRHRRAADPDQVGDAGHGAGIHHYRRGAATALQPGDRPITGDGSRLDPGRDRHLPTPCAVACSWSSTQSSTASPTMRDVPWRRLPERSVTTWHRMR